jgi:hypothetical protein
VAIPPHPEEGVVHQATDMLGRSLHRHHPHQRRCVPGSEEFPGADDGRPSGHAGAVPGGYSGRVALWRGQCIMGQEPLAARRPARPLSPCLPVTRGWEWRDWTCGWRGRLLCGVCCGARRLAGEAESFCGECVKGGRERNARNGTKACVLLFKM